MDDNAKKEKKIHKKILLWFDQMHEKNTILEDSKKLYSVLIDENFKLKKLR